MTEYKTWKVTVRTLYTCCGRMKGVEVRGKHTERACGAKCQASKGPTCECSCGGKNHGKAYLGG